ncbi:major facilitator superfamily domain-containing protein 1-like isoform X1 [Crassostrea angulata]|uniref:major facilitator superfamily domain-containing protein 1-like isoform X1 n=2 Tax=Magallana angulata TaxID=2784310 RepID=UPI0022B20E87|nr:major facilitator superfamily domain-containing protein 1-like isoform X1 [Crassostrea angulata]
MTDSQSEKKPLLGAVNEGDDGEEEVLEGCGGTMACNPHRPLHRYLVLAIMCFLSFGSYFCYDNPAALQDTMIKALDISESTFMGFYSWYSWPNVILCFFGGFLIDRVFGVRMGAIIFSLFVTAGQVLFAAGALVNHVWLMNLGRFVFGIGGESLCVAQNTYAVKWFQGKELNMVFGLQLSFSRVGSTVNMNIMQPIYQWITGFGFKNDYTDLGVVLMIGAIMCVFSLFCALALSFFDKRADRILKRAAVTSDEQIRITDVKDFPLTFWLLSIICVGYYVAVFPFIGLGLVFFEMKWGFEPNLANNVNSLVYIISAVASPVFGFLIDRTGRNVFWVILGTVCTIGCHALLAFTFLNPYVAMSCMGLAYSILASALWPIASQIVRNSQLGTAYGIMQAIQNLGLAVIAIVAGAIVDSSGYLILEVFFLACLCVALIAAVMLYLVDASRGGKLNRSAKERRRLAALKEEEEEEKKLLD